MEPLKRLGVSLLLLSISSRTFAEAAPPDLTTLSLEQLANLEVTSVSKKPEKSFRAPAAVYVISQEDIARFLGISRQVVNQYLQGWKANGWVELGRGKLTGPSGATDRFVLGQGNGRTLAARL